MLHYFQYAFYLLTRIIETMLFARAILSWFPMNPDNFFYKIYMLLWNLTEPMISPVRSLMYRIFPRLRELPIDLSFLVVFMLVSLMGRLVLSL